jgi:hypothetical protein
VCECYVKTGKSLWPVALLVGLMAASCYPCALGQSEFTLHISPTFRPGQRVTAGEELRFVITASLPDTAAPSEKVELDIILSAAQRGERQEMFNATWSLNPLSIGRGEQAVLILRISPDQPPNLVAALVRGRFRGNEVLVPISLMIIGRLSVHLSHHVVSKGRVANVTITVAPSDVLVNGTISLPREQERHFTMRGTYTFTITPKDTGRITILVSAQDYTTSRLEINVVEELPPPYTFVIGAGFVAIVGTVISIALRRMMKKRPASKRPLSKPWFRKRDSDLESLLPAKPTPADASRRCSLCGHEITTKFCPNCGTKQE